MKPLALTCGDPAGIGPEVVQAWLRTVGEDAREVVAIGPARWLAGLPLPPERRIAVGDAEYAAVPGHPDPAGARLAWAAMERAAAGCLAAEFSGVVTGPVAKAELARVGFPHAGQTEFFASRWPGDPTMAFCGGRLRVALLTWHIPLTQVATHLTPRELERTVAAAAELARADGVSEPRIAVCGLNPHAGEESLLGTEERERIDPVLDRLRPRFPGLSRCVAGDTAFGRALRGEFDVVVALYHDQGLAPLKTLEFDEAVNVTLGLAHVRTSPDHGTAFGIAGLGQANPRSFAQAVAVARRLIARRPTSR
jgi:4-hydroxythreonine-4-phosphate dehydrogenase